MNGNIRGIECSIDNGGIGEILLFLAAQPFEFYVSWCAKIDEKQTILPATSNDFSISAQELKELSKASIWELVMQINPIGMKNFGIKSFDDYSKSPCLCYLIFYDCTMLDIYVKDVKLRDQLCDLLLRLGVTDMEFITDESDRRTILHVF